MPYTADEKIDLVRQYESLPRGSTERAELLARIGVSRNAIGNWKTRLGLRVCGCGTPLEKYQHRCPPCTTKATRHRNVRKLYGLAAEEYEALLEAQDGLCAACGNPPDPNGARPQRSLHVDHDHETGRVRGLLCHPCNLALGYAREDVARLLGLVEYLVKHD